MSWVMEAIEREAMARAERNLDALALDRIVVAGCTGKQLLWLALDYQKRTGQRAAEIDPKAPHE